MKQPETFFVKKANGKRLTATAFTPSAPNGRTLLISVATGMKQTFYYNFAEYCAEAGYHTYTYDYSDIGLSKQGDIRLSDTSYTTWGAEDYPAMVRFLREKHPEQPLFVIGHSFGGNCLGMAEASLDVAAFVTIASQQGYWRGFSGWHQFRAWFVFAVSMPLLTRLFGYFPAQTHGLGEDLPKNVLYDWAEVILKPEGIRGMVKRGVSYFERLTQNMLIISIDDDENAPKQAVDKFAACFPNAKIERKHIAPKDGNADAIGHLNFFRKKFQPTLWQIPLQWLERQASDKHRNYAASEADLISATYK